MPGKAGLPPRIAHALALLGARPGERVLEIGCGPGVAAAALCEQMGPGRLTAIDRAATAIATARRRCAARVAAGRLVLEQAAPATARLADAPFDRAIAVNVNGFWRGAAEDLAALHRALRPGGRLVLAYEAPGADQAARILAALEPVLRGSGFTVARRVAAGEIAPRFAAVVARR